LVSKAPGSGRAATGAWALFVKTFFGQNIGNGKNYLQALDSKSDLVRGKVSCYQVVAYNSAGESGPTMPACAAW
jgi:hypothetical protein